MDHFRGYGSNHEKLAGTLEAIFGGLERKGLTNVLKAFVQYGITVLIAICEDGGHVVDTMTAIMGNRSPERCVHAGCGSAAGGIIGELTAPVQQMGKSRLKDKIAELHKQLLLELTTPPVRFIPQALTEPVPFVKTRWDIHPNNPSVYRWILQCVDCGEQCVTPYGRGDAEALSSAVKQGWGKARSSSWARSCRCPAHHNVWDGD